MNPLELRFPLDDEYLPKVYLDTHTVSGWTKAAKSEITNVVLNRNSWYYRGDELKDAFKLVYEKESLKGYTRKSQTTGKKDFLCLGHIQLPLDDVAYGLYSENTFEQRSVQAQLYQEHFLDAAILHVSERQSQDDPFQFAGVKWAALSSPAPGAAPRDYVYFEYSCKTKDADGRDVVVQYTECPELLRHQVEEHDTGLVRSNIFLINTFRLDGDNGTLCQSAGSFEVAKNGPSWTSSSKTVHQIFRSILNLVGLADARAIMNLGVLKKVPKSPADNDKKVCSVCTKKFNMLTRARQKCRSCGHFTCRHCIVGLRFFNETSLYSSTLPVTTEKFCLKCVMHSRDQRQDGGSLSLSYSGSHGPSMSMSPSVCSDTNTTGSFLNDDYKSSSASSHDSDAFVHDIISKMDSTGSSSFDLSDLRKKLSTASETELDTPSAAAKRQVGVPNSSSRLTSPINCSLLDSAAKGAPSATAKSPTLSGQHALPPGASSTAAPDLTAFSKMTQSIAAQNTLLMTIQQERQKMHTMMAANRGNRAPSYNFVDSPPISPCLGSTYTSDEDRFEILE